MACPLAPPPHRRSVFASHTDKCPGRPVWAVGEQYHGRFDADMYELEHDFLLGVLAPFFVARDAGGQPI